MAGAHMCCSKSRLSTTSCGARWVVADVDRMGLLPPSWEGKRNDLAPAAAKTLPHRVALTGRFDPEAPDARTAIKG